MGNKTQMRKLFSDTIIYGLSSIVGRFLNYLLVPIYTYTLIHSNSYGVVTNLYAYTALLLVVLTFGMESTFFYFANRDKENYGKVFSTALSMVSFVALTFALVINIFINPVATSIGYADHPEYVRIMSVIVAFDAIQAILFSFLRFKGRAWKFAILKLTFIVCNIGLNLFVFLVAPRLAAANSPLASWYSADNQVLYIFLINLICTLPITLAFIPELKMLRLGVDKKLIRQMLSYTWPLLLLGLAGILNQVADKICFRFIIPGDEGDTQLGIYGACAKIAMIMAMITQAFRYAYEPIVFSSKGKENKETQATVMKYFVIVTLLAFLAVCAYLDILKHIISSKYWAGLRVVPIVMLAEIFMGIYFNLSFWYKLIAKTWWGAILSATGCAVLLAVNFIFVPRYGYMACAWGGVCGYGVCMLLSYILGQHYNKVDYPVKTIAAYFVVAMALFAGMTLLKPSSTWLSLSLNTLLLLAYVAFTAFNEKELVGGVIRRLTKRK